MPVGAPLTLHTLAAAMIAESDNTATEVLNDYLGREQLEAISGITPIRRLSTRMLCELIDKVSSLDLATINASVLDPNHWQRLTYKGGSETGSLNLTTLATDPRGRTFCVSMTLNDDQAVDERVPFELYRAVFTALAARP